MQHFATLCNIASTPSAPTRALRLQHAFWFNAQVASAHVSACATPPRKTNPPKAQPTQPKTHLAQSRPPFPLKTLTLFLTKRSQPPMSRRAISATLPPPPHQHHAHSYPDQSPRRLRVK
jgi:hypothetical protein